MCEKTFPVWRYFYKRRQVPHCPCDVYDVTRTKIWYRSFDTSHCSCYVSEAMHNFARWYYKSTCLMIFIGMFCVSICDVVVGVLPFVYKIKGVFCLRKKIVVIRLIFTISRQEIGWVGVWRCPDGNLLPLTVGEKWYHIKVKKLLLEIIKWGNILMVYSTPLATTRREVQICSTFVC